MGEELSKRNLRFHYGGNFREIGRVGSMLHMYTGGEVVDSKDWDGDEVCLMDLVKEVYKLISIPECCKVKLWWFWLFRKEGYANQRLLLGEDIDVMFLWENAKPDKENCIHLYVEVENKSQVASTCANSSVPPKPLSNINNSEFQLSPVKRSSQICKDELRIQVIQGGSKEINLNRSSNLI